MNNLLVTNNESEEVTMTSVELLEVINQYRSEDGKKVMRHNNFMQKIRDEFEEEALLGMQTSYRGRDNASTICYVLDKASQVRMLIREGIKVEGYQVVGTKDRLEFSFHRLLTSAFPELEWVCQKSVLKYFLDYYCPRYNLAVEYDEDYHNGFFQKKKDLLREVDIVHELACTFIRVKEGEEGKGLIAIHNFILSENYRNNILK